MIDNQPPVIFDNIIDEPINDNETNINKKRVYVYKSKNKYVHPNLGTYFLARFSYNENDTKLRREGYYKTITDNVLYFLGLTDSIFINWGDAKAIKSKIRYKIDLEKFINEYELKKRNRNLVLSEIFTL